MKEFLQILSRGETLTASQAGQAMRTIMRGEAEPPQIAALLMGMRTRNESVEELTAFARVMREYAIPVRCEDPHAIDLCGTGGDGSQTFNISTASAIVCAGAGVTVAKHGNRSISSKCGSTDVLEALGVNVDLGPEQVADCLDEVGLAFIFARHYHPAMRYVMPVRTSMGARTCFNILGPLCNPAGVRRQIVGAFSRDAAASMAAILAELGAAHVIALWSTDNADEITLQSPTLAHEFEDGWAAPRRFTIEPADHGFPAAPMHALTGGDARHNSRLILDVLRGTRGPMRDVVLINSLYGLKVSGKFDSAAHCLEAARNSIDSGAALQRLEQLRTFSANA